MANKRVGTWELERYLLGELPPFRMEEIAKLVEESPDIKKEIEHLKQANANISKQHPSEIMIPEILKRYEENRRKAGMREKAKKITMRRFLYASSALATALILLFVVFNQDGTSPDFTRIKGEESVDFTKTQIVIYKKNNNEVEVLNNGDRAKAGDLLQIAYVPAGKTYGVIFSIDGRGVVTLHHPDSRGSSAILKQEKKNLLSSAYELDNAPDFERFFFVTAMEEVDVQSIIDKAEVLARSPVSAKITSLELPESYYQFSILLVKEKDIE